MNPPKPIEKIVILGGGTAGWMTAAALAHLLDARRISVTLVESDVIGTVGVGEATIPPILLFNRMLGIDEADFVSRTHATYKLGIEFVNWRAQGHRYLHPFGDFGMDMEGIAFHQFYFDLARRGYDRPLSDFSLMAKAAYSGRFMPPDRNAQNRALANIHYAYQFDAASYASYLRQYAETRGVTRIEGRVNDVKLNAETGYITSLSLEEDRHIEGELFIDCSGFRGRLIEEALQTGYEDWSQWLPCDRAIALPTAKTGPAIPYTRSTAHGAGWQWRIPLQHRTGNGHVYCSEFISDDEALATLQRHVDGSPLAEPKQLRFTTGRRRKFWNRNVVAMGLAAGFMEPLESTSIHLIQTAIARLVRLFPDIGFNPADIHDFNASTAFEYERVRDFLMLHYVQTEREDTPFWRHCRALPRPDSLQRKIDQFLGSGRIFRDAGDLFTETSWLAVMNGQGLTPRAGHPLIARFQPEDVRARLEEIHVVLDQAVSLMPDHEAFIRQLTSRAA